MPSTPLIVMAWDRGCGQPRRPAGPHGDGRQNAAPL